MMVLWRKAFSTITAQSSNHTLKIFTDGSCLGNKSVATQYCPAGWSMIVVENESILFEMNGPVVLDTQSTDFIGAEVGSNNTAELSGIGEALSWILSRIKTNSNLVPYDSPSCDIGIFSDSEYAMKSILGIYQGAKNRRLIDNIRQRYDAIQQLVVSKSNDTLLELPTLNTQGSAESTQRIVRLKSVSLEFVKGHSGHKWNDRADALAVLAAQTLSKEC